jgi:hypothetical protein
MARVKWSFDPIRLGLAEIGLNRAAIDNLELMARDVRRLVEDVDDLGGAFQIPSGDFFLLPGGDRLALPG